MTLFLLDKRSHHTTYEAYFIPNDRMAHTRIKPLRDVSAQALQHLGRMLHALLRNVEIRIATPEKDGRPFQGAGIFSRRTVRPDETSTQSHQATIALSIAGSEL